MNEKHFIGIDREFALLVIIEAFHRLSYQKVEKALLAEAVKNTSLRHWYPESRELPKNDPHKSINPWIDNIFKEDLPQLEARKLLEIDRGIKLTERGRSLASECSSFPQYLRFKEEVFQLYRESKKGASFKTSRFYKHLIQKSKRLYRDEALLYDYLSTLEKFPIGIAFEPDKIISYIDPKALFCAIANRIKKGDALRPPFDKAQLEFLKEVCEKYSKSPLKEKPLVEVCGQCVEVEVNNRYEKPETKFTLFVEGQGIRIIAKNFSVERSVKYHGFRVIGIPQIVHGFMQIEAIRIFDRGLYFPTNGRAF